jgi:hypothetical protein
MHAIMPDPQPPADMPRSLHEICEDARRGQCGLCCAMPGEPCAFSGTGPDGYHVARFAWAEAGVLGVALAQWMARDDTKAEPAVRRAANTAMDAIDAMLAELHQLRARLVSEIRASDDSAAARADAMLAEVRSYSAPADGADACTCPGPDCPDPVRQSPAEPSS